MFHTPSIHFDNPSPYKATKCPAITGLLYYILLTYNSYFDGKRHWTPKFEADVLFKMWYLVTVQTHTDCNTKYVLFYTCVMIETNERSHQMQSYKYNTIFKMWRIFTSYIHTCWPVLHMLHCLFYINTPLPLMFRDEMFIHKWLIKLQIITMIEIERIYNINQN